MTQQWFTRVEIDNNETVIEYKKDNKIYSITFFNQADIEPLAKAVQRFKWVLIDSAGLNAEHWVSASIAKVSLKYEAEIEASVTGFCYIDERKVTLSSPFRPTKIYEKQFIEGLIAELHKFLLLKN